MDSNTHEILRNKFSVAIQTFYSQAHCVLYILISFYFHSSFTQLILVTSYGYIPSHSILPMLSTTRAYSFQLATCSLITFILQLDNDTLNVLTKPLEFFIQASSKQNCHPITLTKKCVIKNCVEAYLIYFRVTQVSTVVIIFVLQQQEVATSRHNDPLPSTLLRKFQRGCSLVQSTLYLLWADTVAHPPFPNIQEEKGRLRQTTRVWRAKLRGRINICVTIPICSDVEWAYKYLCNETYLLRRRMGFM